MCGSGVYQMTVALESLHCIGTFPSKAATKEENFNVDKAQASQATQYSTIFSEPLTSKETC